MAFTGTGVKDFFCDFLLEEGELMVVLDTGSGCTVIAGVGLGGTDTEGTFTAGISAGGFTKTTGSGCATGGVI